MQAEVRSVNAGALASVPGRPRPSGIRKHPVDRIEVRDPGSHGSGVVGDGVGSRRHHGGPTKAVYAFAREELDWWERELDRELPDGTFGENLTTWRLDVDAAEVGEQWRVGTALLQVCGPRIPCVTFAAHMGEARWMKRFAARERVGTYLRVVEAGIVEPGDPVEVVHRPGHGLTVPLLFLAAMGDRDLGARFLESGLLAPPEHAWLAARQPRRRSSTP